MLTRDDLIDTLLRVLLAREPLPADLLADWSDEDLAQAMALVRAHRLGPWLHWRLAHAQPALGAAWPAPAKVVLATQFREATLRNLAIQADLVRLHRSLAGAGIPGLALKGAYLAHHAYPHPATRTMRDIDLLVPEAAIMRAFEVLLANGCARLDRYSGDPAAFLAGGKHLPPLRTPSGQVNVEVHARLVHPEHARDGGVDEPGLWARQVQAPIGGQALAFLSPTDLLLHLVVHAAYDHRFDNGPLTFVDLAMLIERQPIDWPLLWQLAGQGGWLRGVALLLAMVEQLCGLRLPPEARAPAEAGLPQGDALAAMVRTAARLSLRDTADRIDHEFVGSFDDARDQGGALGWLVAKAFPPRQRIAAQFPVPADSWRVWFWYPVRWWHGLRHALGVLSRAEMVDVQQRQARGEERRQVGALESWLNAG